MVMYGGSVDWMHLGSVERPDERGSCQESCLAALSVVFSFSLSSLTSSIVNKERIQACPDAGVDYSVHSSRELVCPRGFH